jgi:acyl carrier protein phosphodiesterase
MNYLAHSFLSRNQPALIIGNFLADHLHGNNFAEYPEEIIEGVKLHRKIDAFTDSHEKFKESKRIFYRGYEKYSGILIDIYFDHLLAKNFENYSPVSLKEYSRDIYSVYRAHEIILPHSSLHFLKYVLQNDIYQAYATVEGIERVLFHLSQRINHGVLLNESLGIFLKNEDLLRTNFDTFFNDALKEFNI